MTREEAVALLAAQGPMAHAKKRRHGSATVHPPLGAAHPSAPPTPRATRMLGSGPSPARSGGVPAHI